MDAGLNEIACLVACTRGIVDDHGTCQYRFPSDFGRIRRERPYPHDEAVRHGFFEVDGRLARRQRDDDVDLRPVAIRKRPDRAERML